MAIPTTSNFRVLSDNPSTAEEAASVTVEDRMVTVTGTIVGNNSCYTARLDETTVEEGRLVVRIASYEDADANEGCADALIGITYEASVEFESEPPTSVRVEHNGEPVATTSEPSLPMVLFDRWLHAHEEDSNDIETYRSSSHSFPPSRGRKGFEIHEDGRFVELAISPGDGTLEHQGQWSQEEGTEPQLTVHLEDGTSYVLELVDIEQELLKVRRK